MTILRRALAAAWCASVLFPWAASWFCGHTSPLTNNAIASLIAITFDRYRAFANESRIETERRTEQLRATVLDSLAHAYKTPLTAIRAASTGLDEMGHLSPGQAELVALIDEQTRLLGDLTTRLLTTSRLDGGDVSIHVEKVSVGSLMEETLGGLKDRLASVKVAVEIADDELVMSCDRQLLVMLLTQYIDNACKYSNYGTTITIRTQSAAGEVIFSVHSFGPLIPMADRERIFDRYYRSSTYSNRASGTGIRALCRPARRADSRRLCLGYERRRGRHSIFRGHSAQRGEGGRE